MVSQEGIVHAKARAKREAGVTGSFVGNPADGWSFDSLRSLRTCDLNVARRRRDAGESNGEPKFHKLEPARRVVARGRLAAPGSLSGRIVQALRARTAGRSAGVGRRRALAGSATTATVLPVVSKNSTE